MKHFDQQFHENNKTIVHEESDPVYDEYETKSWESSEGDDGEKIPVRAAEDDGDLSNQIAMSSFQKMLTSSLQILVSQHLITIK